MTVAFSQQTILSLAKTSRSETEIMDGKDMYEALLSSRNTLSFDLNALKEEAENTNRDLQWEHDPDPYVPLTWKEGLTDEGLRQYMATSDYDDCQCFFISEIRLLETVKEAE